MNAEFDVTGRVIETERLILRPFSMDDLDDFFEYAKSPFIGPRAGWEPHKNKEESAKILDIFLTRKKTFAIYHKQDKKVIGSVGIEMYRDYYDVLELDNLKGRELGYVLSDKYWGQGIMPEAVNAVIKYCFDVLKYDFLLCSRFMDNSQSQRVQDKCGFKFVKNIVFETVSGEKRDSVLNIIYNKNK